MALTSGNRSLYLFALASFGLRFILLIQYANQNPFYVRPIVDSAFYLNWAEAINEGKTFFEGVYHHPPGYAFFLAVCLRLFGGNFFPILLLQCLMMEGLGLLIFRTSEQLFNRKSGWLAYVLFTLCGPITFYSMKILAEPLFTLLLFGSFYCIWQYSKNLKLISLFAGAALLGCATELRGNALICVIPAAIVIFQTQKSWKPVAIFCLGFLLCILPVLVRNKTHGGVWSPVAANWGENFYFANNPTSTGNFSSAPGLQTTIEGQIQSVKHQASILAKRDLTDLEAQSFWFQRAVDYIRNQPLDWIKLEGRKVMRLFAWKETSSIYFYELESRYFQSFLRWLFVGYNFLIPLFFIGFLCIPDFSQFRLLLGYLISQVLFLLIFWPELRFLLPLFPFLLVVAGGVITWNKTVLQRRLRVAGIGFLLALWLWINLADRGEVHGREAWFTNAASAFYSEGKNSEAEQMAREALRINPNYADAWVNLGAVLYAKNHVPEARQAWLNALKIQPDHLFALRNLALLAEKENPSEALDLWQRALKAARKQNAPPATIESIEGQIKKF